MKLFPRPVLPVHCPHCKRTIHVSIAKLQQSIVGLVCTGCRKSIPMTPEFVAAIRGIK